MENLEITLQYPDITDLCACLNGSDDGLLRFLASDEMIYRCSGFDLRPQVCYTHSEAAKYSLFYIFMSFRYQTFHLQCT